MYHDKDCSVWWNPVCVYGREMLSHPVQKHTYTLLSSSKCIVVVVDPSLGVWTVKLFGQSNCLSDGKETQWHHDHWISWRYRGGEQFLLDQRYPSVSLSIHPVSVSVCLSFYDFGITAIHLFLCLSVCQSLLSLCLLSPGSDAGCFQLWLLRSSWFSSSLWELAVSAHAHTDTYKNTASSDYNVSTVFMLYSQIIAC